MSAISREQLKACLDLIKGYNFSSKSKFKKQAVKICCIQILNCQTIDSRYNGTSWWTKTNKSSKDPSFHNQHKSQLRIHTNNKRRVWGERKTLRWIMFLNRSSILRASFLVEASSFWKWRALLCETITLAAASFVVFKIISA